MKLLSCEKIYSGDLCKGCTLCITGHKSVIFITGVCHYTCFYCPISDDKRRQDITKVNEHVIEHPDSEDALAEVIRELESCQSKGASFTGGDPLARIDRTCRYMKELKKHFGKQFHIHLYTSLPFVTQENLLKLEEAGLDEIRFHADLEDISSWEKMLFAQDLSFDVGVEIPAIPGLIEKTKELIHFCKQSNVISFINLNELEYSDVSENKLTAKGYVVKDLLSYGIKKSEELAKELVEFGDSIGMRVHYCSAGFKDEVQLGNRLRLRADRVAQDFDLVDDEGMLTRGEILCVQGAEKELDLESVKLAIEDYFELPEELIAFDDTRILIAPWVLRNIIDELKENTEQFPWMEDVECAIVKEYPTDDHFVLERDPL